MKQLTCAPPHLICKQYHDGVLTRAGGRVLDCKCVIVVLDDVKIDVGLSRSHHTWSTFDPNANVTCQISKSISTSVRRGKKGSVWTGPHPGQPHCSPP